MLSDLDCAYLCWQLYNNQVYPWDFYLPPSSGVCLALKRYPAETAIVCQGTIDAHQWVFNDLDSEFFRTISDYSALGDVPFGFSLGVEDALKAIANKLIYPVRIMGHSLGAAHASLLAGMICEQQSYGAISGLVTMGSPRPGMGSLSKLLAPVPKRIYRNTDGKDGIDYVTTVPTKPPFDELAPFTDVCDPPQPNDPWGLLAWHHLELYLGGMGGVVPEITPQPA